ncbi:MAG: hypothetical protein OXE50_09635, partial [Chloroflexi bacterium]|nr:hypothetical protein [Chloroflexota bacterium]
GPNFRGVASPSYVTNRNMVGRCPPPPFSPADAERVGTFRATAGRWEGLTGDGEEDGYLYTVRSGPDELHRFRLSDISGGRIDTEKLADLQDFPSGIVYHEGVLWVMERFIYDTRNNYTQGRLVKYNLDGSMREVIGNIPNRWPRVSGPPVGIVIGPQGIAILDGKFYYLSGQGWIVSADFDTPLSLQGIAGIPGFTSGVADALDIGSGNTGLVAFGNSILTVDNATDRLLRYTPSERTITVVGTYEAREVPNVIAIYYLPDVARLVAEFALGAPTWTATARLSDRVDIETAALRPTFRPRLRVLIDWLDDGGFSHPASDVSADCVAFAETVGFDPPRDVSSLDVLPADGTVVLKNDSGRYDPRSPNAIDATLLRLPHLLRMSIAFEVGGVLVREALVWEGLARSPEIRDEQDRPLARFRLEGKNAVRFRSTYNRVDYDPQDFDTAMGEIGVTVVRAAEGGQLPELIQIRDAEGTFGQFLQRLARFAGGWMFEDEDGRLMLVDPAAAAEGIGPDPIIRQGVHRINPTSQNVELEQLVRNSAAVRTVTPGRTDVQTYMLEGDL